MPFLFFTLLRLLMCTGTVRIVPGIHLQPAMIVRTYYSIEAENRTSPSLLPSSSLIP